jgi:steroid delta-isomerase-like uncharacterized protein
MCDIGRQMSQHNAIISWKRTSPDFLKGKYSREHTWSFDGGVTVPASASVSAVPVPYSNPACVDPEEAFVAAVSSCHMLTFLYLASKQGFQIDSYRDEAVGVMKPNDKGIPWVSAITLSPHVTYGGERVPRPEDEERLHHMAHEQCFIANSIKTTVTVRQPSAGASGELWSEQQPDEKNKAVVQAFVEAINQQDWRRFDELVSPDFVRHSSTFGQSEIRTREQLRDYLAGEFKSFPNARETINFLIADGDKVTVHSHCDATQSGKLGSLPPSGKKLSADFISIYRIAKGRIAEAWVEWDCLNGLIQLGHVVPPAM